MSESAQTWTSPVMPRDRRLFFPIMTCCLWWLASPLLVSGEETLFVNLTIASKLSFRNVPFDPTIDFADLIRQAKVQGVLDPQSITVTDLETGNKVAAAVTEDFAYGEQGRVEWVIEEPDHLKYEIRFRVADVRPPQVPAAFIPAIGTGDLLRYNAGVPRPIGLPYLSRLVDLTGDGKADLVGCWNYAHRPGAPWDGIVCFPRTDDGSRFEFGDLVRVRSTSPDSPLGFHHFTSTYMNAEIADLNGDGLPDIVNSPMQGNRLTLHLNTGKRDVGGMPIFVDAGEIPRPKGAWEACRVLDLNGDQLPDLVVGDYYLRNTNPKGWPIQVADPIQLNAGHRACFLDLDDDGLQDSAFLQPSEKPGPAHPPRPAWSKNLGGSPPRFGPAHPLEEIDAFWCGDLAAVNDSGVSGLLVQHDIGQKVSFYEKLKGSTPHFRRSGLAESRSAVLTFSDQAWPCLCDWNDDGLIDLLIGGGYGWPRIVINRGTRERAAYTEPQLILSEGQPIRILMSDVYPNCEEYKHNMGYPYPVFTDWDGDGLSDLMLPNCSNRLFWYRNIGTKQEPQFGPRQQLNPVGHEDSPQKRLATGEILMTRWEGELEAGQPFFWRTGAAFADFNGDGLTDFVTHDGETRKATLFTQFREESGGLRLKKGPSLKLADGRLIDDSLVGRSAHWTESFRATDWDRDGLIDLVYSCSGSTPKGSIYLLRNVGTKQQPEFEEPRTLSCFGQPLYLTAHGPHPWVGDYDGDGTPDLVACVEWSVYPFYRHAAIEMTERPTYSLSTVRNR